MSKKNHKEKKSRGELPATASKYMGPVVTGLGLEGDDLHTQTFSVALDLASDGSGVIANVIGDAPTAASDWASAVALYKEYRVLAHEVRFYPQNRYSKSTTVTRPIAVVIDRSDSSSLTSYLTAAVYTSHKIKSTDDPFSETCHMVGINEASFSLTSSPTITKWIKFWSSGNSFSTTYGIYVVSYRVQFRVRA
jgi:hypothetical protein